MSLRLYVVLFLFVIGAVEGCSGSKPSTPAPTASTNTTAANPATSASSAESMPSESSEASVDSDSAAQAKQETETAPSNQLPAEPVVANEPQVPASEKVTLGSPDLTSGIPGEGSLTVEQIRPWIDDPRNHATLEIELPFGLSAAIGQIQIPEDNPMTRAKIELGRQLYFDRRLSSVGTVSCADCHHPDEGYARNTQFGIGIDGQQGGRNSPVSFNRILSSAQFWDGRAGSLEEQAIGPIANPIEMGNTHEAAVATVNKIESYRIQFEKIFGSAATIEAIGKAIATFERAVVTGPSPFDYYEPLRALQVAFKEDLEDLELLKEDDPDLYEDYTAKLAASEAHPISESAKRGREIFFSAKGSCTACHVGANLADEKYHNLGIGMDQDKPDLGRFAVTKDDKDRGAFKTPTVRNVAMTAPYMHDGSLKTLEEVVEWYAKGGHPNPHLSKDVKKLVLSEQDKKDLVEFMKACTGELPKSSKGDFLSPMRRIEVRKLPPRDAEKTRLGEPS